MNAVATPTKAKPASASVKSLSGKANPTDEFTPAAIKAAFGQVETLLNEAYMTDEDHQRSGDSDRLLDIAHSLADKAMIEPPKGAEIERVAFNIAALIRAARLVPGDGESPQRKALIDQAAVHLNWLTECDICGSDCCDPGVPRPAHPKDRPPNQTIGNSEETECLELARQSTYEIQRLAETMQVVAEQFGSEEHPVINGFMARIIVLSEIAFNAAALHGGGRSESRPLSELRRAFKGRI